MGDIAQRGNKLTKGPHGHGPKPFLNRPGQAQGTHGGKATGGRVGKFGGGRTNLLEELGRVEAEPSNRNRRAEIARVHGELNRGYATGGRVGFQKGKRVGHKRTGNTQRENRLEELGRVDSERAWTKHGKRDLRLEKHRIREELKKVVKLKKIKNGFKKLINQLKQEERKENVHLLQNQAVQAELKL